MLVKNIAGTVGVSSFLIGRSLDHSDFKSGYLPAGVSDCGEALRLWN